MSTQNILNVEATLKDIQDTIRSDEKVFRNWNMETENKRTRVRNAAATMILKTKSLGGIKSLERPRMKKIRYLLDPTSRM